MALIIVDALILYSKRKLLTIGTSAADRKKIYIENWCSSF